MNTRNATGIAQSETPFNTRMPYVGEAVLFYSNPDDVVAQSNQNPGPIAAIVTRVWSAVCVNLKIIPDHGPMQDRGSVVHWSANPAGYHFVFLGVEAAMVSEKKKIKQDFESKGVLNYRATDSEKQIN